MPGRKFTFIIVAVIIIKSVASFSHIYHNQFALHIPRGQVMADELAAKHGFTNLGQVLRTAVNTFHDYISDIFFVRLATWTTTSSLSTLGSRNGQRVRVTCTK